MKDLEYKVNLKNMKKCDRATVGLPKIMWFDIEVNSSNPSAMPKAEKPEDKIFQTLWKMTTEFQNKFFRKKRLKKKLKFWKK